MTHFDKVWIFNPIPSLWKRNPPPPFRSGENSWGFFDIIMIKFEFSTLPREGKRMRRICGRNRLFSFSLPLPFLILVKDCSGQPLLWYLKVVLFSCQNGGAGCYPRRDKGGDVDWKTWNFVRRFFEGFKNDDHRNTSLPRTLPCCGARVCSREVWSKDAESSTEGGNKLVTPVRTTVNAVDSSVGTREV